MRDFDDAELMAYADGVLPGARADAIERAAAYDPALLARIAAFRDSQRILREAFHAVLQEPVPARLLRAAGGQPGPAMPSVQRAPVARQHAWMALAASVVVGVTMLLWSRPSPHDAGGTAVALTFESGVLERVASGEPTNVDTPDGPVEVLVLATYRDPVGRYCRSYEVVASSGSGTPQRGFGCRAPSGTWTAAPIQVALGADAPSEFAPAGADLGVPVGLVPLDAAQEATVLRDGWSP
jgi:surface antigen